ncbi:hypothetical protein A6F68_01051 [Tsuneonella dongtanensis]|uniref:Uncharacterized protein n=1 Tax=Tsuneonella dongtanensis TaxID=692370 RepID=A0A1B2ABM8_9SPHN|nr:hypothetical protein A6F68_01051 [Tsuneonella dongtanensis]
MTATPWRFRLRHGTRNGTHIHDMHDESSAEVDDEPSRSDPQNPEAVCSASAGDEGFDQHHDLADRCAELPHRYPGVGSRGCDRPIRDLLVNDSKASDFLLAPQRLDRRRSRHEPQQGAGASGSTTERVRKSPICGSTSSIHRGGAQQGRSCPVAVVGGLRLRSPKPAGASGCVTMKDLRPSDLAAAALARQLFASEKGRATTGPTRYNNDRRETLPPIACRILVECHCIGSSGVDSEVQTYETDAAQISPPFAPARTRTKASVRIGDGLWKWVGPHRLAPSQLRVRRGLPLFAELGEIAVASSFMMLNNLDRTEVPDQGLDSASKGTTLFRWGYGVCGASLC